MIAGCTARGQEEKKEDNKGREGDRGVHSKVTGREKGMLLEHAWELYSDALVKR